MKLRSEIRQSLSRTAFLAGAVGLIALTMCGHVAAQNARPNIVVILCDDLGYGDLECYGHPHIKTPRLNELAASGLRLTSCYSAAPVCSPSRVGLLTGRSPNRAGVYDWIPSAGSKADPDARDQVHLRKSEVTVAGLLQKAGYATCMSGKWHCNAKFNSPAQPQPSDAGFDHWFGTQNNASPSHENPNNFVRNGEKVGELSGFSCQLAAEEAIGWMRKSKAEKPEQPFFVYLAFHEPHEPVASPESLVKQYLDVAESEDQAQYFANVANVDAAVGKVVDALEQMGQRDNTLIVFSSDNGPETLNRYARANRSHGVATPLRGMKLWTTEAGFRVAGIMSWPAKVPANQVSDTVISSLDFLPSFCELAKMQPPTELQLDGISFAGWLSGGPLKRTKPLLWCYFNATNEQRVAMRSGPWKMLAKLNADSLNSGTLNSGTLPRLQNVSDGNRAKILAAELGDFELYRVTEDLSETMNVADSAAQSPQLQELMRTQYRQLVETSHFWTRKELE